MKVVMKTMNKNWNKNSRSNSIGNEHDYDNLINDDTLNEWFLNYKKKLISTNNTALFVLFVSLL